MPPSAEIVSPVTKRAASDARNTTTGAMSSGFAHRRSGVCASICSTTPGIALLRAQSAVSTTPGDDRVHADPGRSELHRERAGGGVDRALRRRVGRAPRRAHDPRDRRRLTIEPRPRFDHRRQQRRDQQQGSAHVHREHRVDRRRVEVDGGRAGPRRPRCSRGCRRRPSSPSAACARPVGCLPRRRARRAARRGRGADRAATASSSSRSRPERATRAPAASSAAAIAAPMPREAPVTSAVRPSSENSSMAEG